MEITRRDPATPGHAHTKTLEQTEFRARQLKARDMLNGDLDGDALEQHVKDSIVTTTVDAALQWARGNSIYPMTFGLACCAMEMMATVASRVDVARFGWEAYRASPRQADLLILSGRVSIKMAPIIRRVWDQMLEPKWAISMGACCSSMGVFNNYALVPADKFMPIAIHVPGCPPRPEGLMHGILKLRQHILESPDTGWRERYGGLGTEEIDDYILNGTAPAFDGPSPVAQPDVAVNVPGRDEGTSA